MTVNNERDRYHSMPSHHPDIRFMVWDFYGNTAIAYSYEREQADQVARALSDQSTVWWDEDRKTWMDGNEEAHIKEFREMGILDVPPHEMREV